MTEIKERLPSVNEAIEKALKDRFCEIESNKIQKNKKYIEATSAAIELYDQLKPYLSDEGLKLLREYEIAAMYAANVETLMAYRQGIRDGLALPKAWGGAM